MLCKKKVMHVAHVSRLFEEYSTIILHLFLPLSAKGDKCTARKIYTATKFIGIMQIEMRSEK